MNSSLLQTLGINLKSDIPTDQLLSESFNPKSYGLTKTQEKKIRALRDIITEYNQSIPLDKKVSVSSSRIAAEILRPTFKGLGHEECWVLFLNRANYPITKEKLSSGGFSSTTLDVQSIVRSAILNCATGIIIFHNHPSGSPVPGGADIQATKSLETACKTLEIALLDHIIITESSFYSFSDEEISQFR